MVAHGKKRMQISTFRDAGVWGRLPAPPDACRDQVDSVNYLPERSLFFIVVTSESGMGSKNCSHSSLLTFSSPSLSAPAMKERVMPVSLIPFSNSAKDND